MGRFRLRVRGTHPAAEATGHRQSPAGAPLAGPDPDPRPAKAQPPTVPGPGPGGTRLWPLGDRDAAGNPSNDRTRTCASEDRVCQSRV